MEAVATMPSPPSAPAPPQASPGGALPADSGATGEQLSGRSGASQQRGDVLMADAGPPQHHQSQQNGGLDIIGPSSALGGIIELAVMPGTEHGPKYKRGRGRSFFKEQPKKGAVCQVPGCDRSLHKLRDYYKRYKICPYHLELPCLVVEGQTIRFCQQCGRFQLLSDFEGDRRSCRRKLDKHNERRRKAEAEQKARLMDSGSDSPGGGAGRGHKAHRVSPMRPPGGKGGFGGATPQAMFMGLGAPGVDLGMRLKALAADPTLREGLAPSLLQSLAADPTGQSGMDWLAAGSLANMALGPAAAPAPPPAPQAPPAPVPRASPQALPAAVMALLPPEIQQQVMQQGAGILNAALLAQLQQQMEPAAAAQPVQPQPQRTFGFGALSGLFGGGQATAPQAPPMTAPFGAPPAHAISSAMPASLQQQQQQRGPLSPADAALRSGLDGANLFMRSLQQVQQPQQQVPPAAPVPLLRSAPVGAPPAAAAPAPTPAVKAEPGASPAPAAGDGNDKAALLVALARSVGVSSQDLAKALMQNGVPNGQAQQTAGPETSPAAPTPLAANGLTPATGAHGSNAHLSPQQQASAQPSPPQGQQAQMTMSESLARAASGVSAPSHLLSITDDAMRSISSLGNAASQGAQPGQAGTLFRPLATAGSGALPAGLQAPPAAAAPSAVPTPALAPAAAPAAAAAAANARQMLDLEQLQSAVQSNGLSPGFASDANLLLQLVAAVEAAQREAGPGKERMHSLSLKLFNCTPDRLPKNILDQLESWMVQNKSLLDGASRPGCVQLSVSALLSGQEFEALSDSFGGLVQRLARGGLCGVQTSILAQLDGQATLVDVRKQALVQMDVAASAGCAVPEIASVRPLVVPPGYQGPFLVTGRNIGDAQDGIFCRRGDAWPTTEVLGRGALLQAAPGEPNMDWVLLRIPDLQAGSLQLEAQRGTFVSAPHSILVLGDEQAVAELRDLEAAGVPAKDVQELLPRLGAVLRFGEALREAGGADGGDPTLLARVAAAAQELSATCILRGWGAVLGLMLPLACARCSPAAALAGIERQLGGMPVLHAAALKGGAGVVRALGAWAAGSGLELRLDACWGGGLTPLHVATLLREPESVAVALTELAPRQAATTWAAACAEHGRETPLGLACRLNKRGLLRVLATHGVHGAAAMLAALLLQDESVRGSEGHVTGGAAPAVRSPVVGIEGPDDELERQRRQWATVCCDSAAKEAAATRFASRPTRSWPGCMPTKATREAADDALCSAGILHAGHESPSSVLSGLSAAACASATAEVPADDLTPGSSGEVSLLPANRPPAGKASLRLACKALDAFDADAGLSGKGGVENDCLDSCVETIAEWRARQQRWTPARLLKPDMAILSLVLLLLCCAANAAPLSARQQLHLWLLSTVARAPLMLQPLLLLCQPVRSAYRRCSGLVLVGLHAAMLGLQWGIARTHGADWLAVNPVLGSPAGVWLLATIFSLQLHFSLQAPALLAVYCANVLLLPDSCRSARADLHAACSATRDARVYVAAAMLPLLAYRLLGGRARRMLASLRTPAVGQAAA